MTSGSELVQHRLTRAWETLDEAKLMADSGPGIFPQELATLYNALFDARQESDYEDFFRADPEDVRQ